MDGLISLIAAGLATWRIAVMVWYEAGPLDVFSRFRGWIIGLGELSAEIIDCFWCVTLLVSLPVLLVWWLWWPALLPLALSAAAILLSGGGRMVWHQMVEDEQ